MKRPLYCDANAWWGCPSCDTASKHTCAVDATRVSVDSNEHLCTLQRRDAPPRPSPRQAPATALRPWRRTWRAWPARGNCTARRRAQPAATLAPHDARPPRGDRPARQAQACCAPPGRAHTSCRPPPLPYAPHTWGPSGASLPRAIAPCACSTHTSPALGVSAPACGCSGWRVAGPVHPTHCSGGPLSPVSRRLSRRRARHHHPPGTEASLPAPRRRRPSRLGQLAGQQQQQRWWRRRTLRGCPYRQPAPTACGSCPHLTWASSSG